jgi:hypothetical protein
MLPRGIHATVIELQPEAPLATEGDGNGPDQKGNP